MTKRRYSFLDELIEEKNYARKRIQEIDARIEKIHPLWKEEERIKKERDKLSRKLNRLP